MRLPRLFSEYCGVDLPFDPARGPPQHAVDQACKTHDERYQKMLDSGTNPYLNFNEADRLFLEELSGIVPQSHREAIVKEAAEGVFLLKKIIANSGDPTQRPLAQSEEVSRKFLGTIEEQGISFGNFPATCRDSALRFETAKLSSINLTHGVVSV